VLQPLQSEAHAVEHVMNRGVVPRSFGPGRPRLCPAAIVGDKGYRHRRVRRWCHAHRIRPIIPTRRDQRHLAHFDRKAYRQRNIVERLISQFKRTRRVATRYDKRAVHFPSFVLLAAIRLWL
jgi:transposase